MSLLVRQVMSLLLTTPLLKGLPTSLLKGLPTSLLKELPTSLLKELPTSLLKGLPTSLLVRLPTSLLERLPTELVRNLPEGPFDNIPEDVYDQIREAIQSSAFDGKELKQQLLHAVKEILGQTLVTSSGELPATIIRVSVRANLTKQTAKKLLKHEDLQEHILNMIRVHSTMVALVPLLGMGEEKVYKGLLTKTEEIWQIMRLHPSMPGRS